MASAAAVAADEARSPINNDIGDDRGLPGEITSGVYSKDEEIPNANGDAEDSDEDLPANPLRGHRPARPRNDDDDEEAEDENNDLFGDEEEEEKGQPARRLDDEELDSGDDMDRTDRYGDGEEQAGEYITQEKITMDLNLPRQPIPEPSDGEMYLLKMPNFIGIQPKAFNIPDFQPPTTDHHSFKAPSATFSAYNTALSTIRWRHSPSDHSKLQSNARINRWSDGSLTLQLASDPTTQYEIDGNPLAPPQRNPIKPTPVSRITNHGRGGRAGIPGAGQDEKYVPAKDAFTYLVRPHLESGTMIVTHKITAGLSIKQSSSLEDDAIERLQASLAAAAGAGKVNGTNGLLVALDDKDPEEAKRNALIAQRKIEAERRKRQVQEERANERANRNGRAGVGGPRYSGLNVGMLEDEEEGTGTHRSPNKRASGKARRRRNSEYSEDEDFGRRNFQNDEYDRDDDFLAASDEEEVVDDDDDPDDGIVEESRHGRRERTPKRDRAAAEEGSGEEDAPGEEDEEEASHAARSKRRRVVDDDDDEDEE